MAEPLRHRQTKEAATDMFYLKPPRHISTLPKATFEEGPVLLRVSDAGRSQRCGLHRGRRPKAFNEGTRGKLQAVAPRAPSAMEVCAAKSCVRATDGDGCVGWRRWAACAGICGKPGKSMATLTSQKQICTSAAVADRGPARKIRILDLCGGERAHALS